MGVQSSVQDAMLAAMPQLHAFALKLCRNPDQANDLVQETMMRGCQSIAAFQPGSNMIAWLTTILRNQFFSENRRTRNRPVEAIDDFADTLAVPPPQLISVELEELRTALDQLKFDERASLVLTLGAGHSYEEVAKICGCPVGTIKSRVNRARRRLLALLSGETSSGQSDAARAGMMAFPIHAAAPRIGSAGIAAAAKDRWIGALDTLK
jgi:RNA polymerase sigma-70 factor (ECF subfamily)